MTSLPTIDTSAPSVVAEAAVLDVIVESEQLSLTVPQQGVNVHDVPSSTDVFAVPVIGPRGPAGAAGLQGPPGPGGGGTAYTFTQSSPSAMWHIVHGNGADPSVVVRTAGGVTLGAFGSVYSEDRNTVDLYFGLPIAGIATLNF